MAEDTGTIINSSAKAHGCTSPDDARLPPIKLVEGVASVTATHGQTLAYTITFRNNGDVDARNAVFVDDLPVGLEYVADSLRLNGQPLTDAADADAGRVNSNRRIEVRFAEVAIGQLVQVSFQARTTAGVPAGTGIVNAAFVSADNASAVTSTNAIAVVNPFGLVYRRTQRRLDNDSRRDRPPARRPVEPRRRDASGRPWHRSQRVEHESVQHRRARSLELCARARTDGRARQPGALFPERRRAEGFRTRTLEALVIPASDAGTVHADAARARRAAHRARRRLRVDRGRGSSSRVSRPTPSTSRCLKTRRSKSSRAPTVPPLKSAMSSRIASRCATRPPARSTMSSSATGCPPPSTMRRTPDASSIRPPRRAASNPKSQTANFSSASANSARACAPSSPIASASARTRAKASSSTRRLRPENLARPASARQPLPPAPPFASGAASSRRSRSSSVASSTTPTPTACLTRATVPSRACAST